MKKYIQISFRTKIDTTSWDIGEKIVHSLTSGEEILKPAFVSSGSERSGFEKIEDIQSIEALWAVPATISVDSKSFVVHQDFSWCRKNKLKYKGYITHIQKNIHNQIIPASFDFNSDFCEKIDFFNLFKKWCEILSPQVAILHLFTPIEISGKHERDAFLRGSFKSALNPELQDIAWAMFYGSEFLNIVDCEIIKKHGYHIEKSVLDIWYW